jgi:hypothetical protein
LTAKKIYFNHVTILYKGVRPAGHMSPKKTRRRSDEVDSNDNDDNIPPSESEPPSSRWEICQNSKPLLKDISHLWSDGLSWSTLNEEKSKALIITNRDSRHDLSTKLHQLLPPGHDIFG